MNLVWLQIRKDLWMTKALLAMFAGALLADLAICQGWIGAPDWVWPYWDSYRGFRWQTFVPQCAVAFGAMLILTTVTQDTPARENGFLLTRPMPTRSIWIGKLIFAVGFVILPALLTLAAHLLLSGVSGSDGLGIAGERLFKMVVVALLVAGVSACAISVMEL